MNIMTIRLHVEIRFILKLKFCSTGAIELLFRSLTQSVAIIFFGSSPGMG